MGGWWLQGPVFYGIVGEVKLVASSGASSHAVQMEFYGSTSGLHKDTMVLQTIVFLTGLCPLNVKSHAGMADHGRVAAPNVEHVGSYQLGPVRHCGWRVLCV